MCFLSALCQSTFCCYTMFIPRKGSNLECFLAFPQLVNLVNKDVELEFMEGLHVLTDFRIDHGVTEGITVSFIET